MTHLRPKRPLVVALAAALALQAANAAAQSAPTQEPAVPADQAAASHANPFFAESPLPLHYPQFDRIHDSDFAPAFVKVTTPFVNITGRIAEHTAAFACLFQQFPARAPA